MANTFAPFGLREFQYKGAAPTYELTRVLIMSTDATPLAKGDLVQNSTTSGQYVTALTTGLGGSTPRGVFIGCSYYNQSVNRIIQGYFPGSISGSTADVVAYIIDDPDMLFIAQTSTTSVVGSSNIGTNIGTQPSTGNIDTLAGQSKLALLSSTIGSTSANPFRIMDVYSAWAPPGTNGTDNSVAGNIIVVQPNNWSATNLTARST